MRSSTLVLFALLDRVAASYDALHCQFPPNMGYSCGEGEKRWVKRYHYNATAETCMAFRYEGCGGNENRYSSRQECVEKCEAPRVYAKLSTITSAPPTTFGPDPDYAHMPADQLWGIVRGLFKDYPPQPPAFPHASVPVLPQHADSAARKSREESIARAKGTYIYVYNTTVPQAPMMKPLSGLHLPAVEWIMKVAFVTIRTYGGKGVLLVKQLVKDPRKLIHLFNLLFPNENGFTRPKSLDDYNALFPSLPMAASEFELDEAFARWRLAGPNPTTITPCTKEQLSKANLASLPPPIQARINSAFAKAQLFVVDYSELGSLTGSSYAAHSKFALGPLALFALPTDAAALKRQWLEVLAIQCEVPTSGSPPSMFHPGDGMLWRMAKAAFNSVDGAVHEALVHLADTHLVIEAFLVSMQRTLPPEHPIHTLLSPHFEGVTFINEQAIGSLVNPGGPVDQLFNQEIHELNKLVGARVLATLSDDFSFPAKLDRRHMNHSYFAAPFPYRDDGLLIWSAIFQFVERYLQHYYGEGEAAKQAIEADYELQHFIAELRSKDGGNVIWLNRFDNSSAMLGTVLAAVIYTSSAEHAAVNYPQEQIESYSAAFPLGIYAKPPTTRDGGHSSDADYLAMLPPLEMAALQQKIAYLLGGVQYTKLGQYPRGYFGDPKVGAALTAFQQKLAQVTEVIEGRNRERVAAWAGHLLASLANNWAYPYLLPSNIPQSTNI